MKKNKDGKVIASLTEVKNKTGDIFALADEFGEVVLTSYNKPRYKIVKIGITDTINFEAENKEKKADEKKKIASRVTKEVEVVSRVEEEKPGRLIDKNFEIVEWDRNNSKEKSFVEHSTRSLIS